MRRWTKESPCLVCGGCDRDERDEGKRCWGFLSDDNWIHCTRPEHAGNIKLNTKSNAFPHKPEGKCKCGAVHGETTWKAGDTHYEYRDENGATLFRVVRTPDKRFYQQHPTADGWARGLNGARRVLYKLPEIIAADPTKTVYIAEGEKCVEKLRDKGFVATCNPGGAKNWRASEDIAKSVLAGRHVAVLSDADSPGQAWAVAVRDSLGGIAASVSCFAPYIYDGTGRDIYDWFAEGHTADELAEIVGDIVGATKSAPAADPWKAALARALSDVQSRLGDADDSECTPLFDLDAVDLLSKEFDGAKWLVTGLITIGGITTIGGLPKAAKKTWLGSEIAVAISTGTKVCGEFFAERGVVAYFYAEDMEQQIQNRIRALMSGAGRTLEAGKLHLCPRGKFLDITRDKDLARIIASCRHLGKIDVLVLDPLRDIHSAAEDKSDEMSPVMRRLRLLAEILGCTVIVVHHSGKENKDNSGRGGGQRLRGSGAVHGSTDSGIYILKCEGDGRNKFRNTIESEIKGARSAGVFQLDLDIVDDEHDNAECATWTFSRPAPKIDLDDHNAKISADLAEVAAVKLWIKDLASKGIVLSKTALKRREDRPYPERKTLLLIERLINSMNASAHGGRVVIRDAESNGNT